MPGRFINATTTINAFSVILSMSGIVVQRRQLSRKNKHPGFTRGACEERRFGVPPYFGGGSSMPSVGITLIRR